jgi:hypothetical protein
MLFSEKHMWSYFYCIETGITALFRHLQIRCPKERIKKVAFLLW